MSDEDVMFTLREARDARDQAALEYENSIVYATEQGWSNVKIAKILNISEAAIRQYKKRRGIK